jgi:hypothetical protein
MEFLVDMESSTEGIFFGRYTYGNGISVCRDMAMSVLNFVRM